MYKYCKVCRNVYLPEDKKCPFCGSNRFEWIEFIQKKAEEEVLEKLKEVKK